MQDIYINYDDIEKFKKKAEVKVAIVARPDWFMKKAKLQHLIVETKLGTHDRFYLTEYDGKKFVIVYGRFDRIRSMSSDIDYELTQEAISAIGIETIIGTFVAGSIKDDDFAGSVYIPHDFVGMGNYSQTRNRNGFKNVDMFTPFCEETRQKLILATKKVPFPVNNKGIYVCFHGYPRIETKAELDFYGRMGWHMVGQTLDPEATLAKEAGCHYSAIVATIDDRKLRQKFMNNDGEAKREIESNIAGGRKKTFEIFTESLEELIKDNYNCNCLEQQKHVLGKNKHFYYMPMLD